MKISNWTSRIEKGGEQAESQHVKQLLRVIAGCIVAGLDLEAQGGYLAKDREEQEGGGRTTQPSVRLKLWWELLSG